MNIGLIGCGRVGITIFYLLRTQHRIIGVHDIRRSREKKALKLLGMEKNEPLNKLCAKSKAIFIATPDDAIVTAYKTLVPYITAHTCLYHFSGSLPSTVFPKKKWVYRAAVHPFATFPSLKIPPVRTRFPLYIEGDAYARTIAKGIFRKKCFFTRVISRKDKIYYHLIGVFSSNLFIALLYAISELIERTHLTQQDLDNSIFPLIEETLSHAQQDRTYKALSGPLERGDVDTIRAHLKALRHDPLLRESYRTLSLLLIRMLPHVRNKRTLKKMLETP